MITLYGSSFTPKLGEGRLSVIDTNLCISRRVVHKTSKYYKKSHRGEGGSECIEDAQSEGANELAT